MKSRFPMIYKQLNHQLKLKEIDNTNDIWVRDFMPIQNTIKENVLFRYYPKYLQNKRFIDKISDNVLICNQLSIDCQLSNLILDGGSVVSCNEKFFVSTRVLKDNFRQTQSQIIQQLQSILKSDKIYLIPEAPGDFTGHLDGMLTFIDENTVLVNQYLEEFGTILNTVLKKLGFDIVLFPYQPYQNKTFQSARGVYMNFLKTSNKILLPVFNMPEDDDALKILDDYFPKHEIIPVTCTGLENEGGLVHCITWGD